MGALIPLYLKEYFKNDALFKDSKIVTSLYNDSFEGVLSENLVKKITFDAIDKKNLKPIAEASFLNLQKIAVDHSDYVLFGSEDLSDEIKEHVVKQKKNSLEYIPKEEIKKPYTDFYLSIVGD